MASTKESCLCVESNRLDNLKTKAVKCPSFSWKQCPGDSYSLILLEQIKTSLQLPDKVQNRYEWRRQREKRPTKMIYSTNSYRDHSAKALGFSPSMESVTRRTFAQFEQYSKLFGSWTKQIVWDWLSFDKWRKEEESERDQIFESSRSFSGLRLFFYQQSPFLTIWAAAWVIGCRKQSYRRICRRFFSPI